MTEPAGIKIVDSQNWLRREGTHRKMGICSALVLLWLKEIVQGMGQWDVEADVNGISDQAGDRWTPNVVSTKKSAQTRISRSGTMIGTYLGGHAASNIYLWMQAQPDHEKALFEAYGKCGINAESDKSFDYGLDEALEYVTSRPARSLFHVNMFDHSVGFCFCGPEAATFYFDPNYGVYKYRTPDEFSNAVRKHLLDKKYCVPSHRDLRRGELTLIPVSA